MNGEKARSKSYQDGKTTKCAGAGGREARLGRTRCLSAGGDAGDVRELTGARGGEDVWQTTGRQGTGPAWGCGTCEMALGAKHRGRSARLEVGGETLGAALTAGPRRETVRKAWPPAGIAEAEENSQDGQKDLKTS